MELPETTAPHTGKPPDRKDLGRNQGQYFFRRIFPCQAAAAGVKGRKYRCLTG